MKMISLPHELFRYILSFRNPVYEYVFRFGAPSARWVREYVILAPCAEYQMTNGRIVTLYWDLPCISVYGWDVDIPLPSRASF